MKQWEQTFATYLFNYYNICNILIYIYNIHTKHLQYTSKTSEKYACNMYFQPTSTYCFDDLRLVDVELDASEWRKAPMQKVAGTVENVGRTDGPAERKHGG
jgi:hypothetical protein